MRNTDVSGPSTNDEGTIRIGKGRSTARSRGLHREPSICAFLGNWLRSCRGVGLQQIRGIVPTRRDD